MPALVNFSGDDEFYSTGSFSASPVDLQRCFSIGSHVDIYCSPRKRIRFNAPYIFTGAQIEKTKQQPSLDVLPDECLFEILRRLPGGKEKSSSACVSKRWLNVLTSISKTEVCKETPIPDSNDVEMVSSDDEGFLTRCLEGKKATDLRLSAIAIGTSGHGGLGKLTVRGSNGSSRVSDIGISAIARGCPSLRALTLWDVPGVGDEGLSQIAKECHLLEKLDLCQCPLISNKGLIAIAENCPNLSVLSIESCSKIGNEALLAIGKYCQKLQSLSIKDCRLVGDQGVSSLLSSASSVLTKIKLQALNITDFTLAVIGHYGKSVTSLILNGLRSVSEKGFWVMGNAQGLQKLTSLVITSCRGITDLSLEAMGKGFTKLAHMVLRKCCFVSDEGFIAFSKAAESLESIQLEECNRVTQSGVIGSITNCGIKLKSFSLVKCMGIKDTELRMTIPSSSSSSLTSLSVRDCPGFGSSSLSMIGHLCPNLKNLDLSGLHRITDAGLLPLMQNLQSGLVKVNLSGCVNLTDEVVLTLSRQHGTTLELLNLEGCKKITDASLLAIANGCIFLNDLDLSRCGVTDSGLAALSQSEQLNLQILSLAGCASVTNKSIVSLKKLGKTLVGLNLQLCNSIRGKTMDHLLETLWRCDILF